MKILLTGASSFTGYWFAKTLAEAGHEVTIALRRPIAEYSGVRLERIKNLLPLCRAVYSVHYGDESFLKLIREGGWEVLCHHAAEVSNYKSPDFDAVAALANNVRNLPLILKELTTARCRHLILTGSVFEQREGAGSDDLRAVSPYGLSKGLTHDYYRFYTAQAGIHLGKFVIPNPFGPLEEERFTSYLAKTWLKGERARCDFPHYMRDNIPVSLLAKAYLRFVEHFAISEKSYECFNPSGYVESQGAFCLRFARELSQRWGIACPIDLVEEHSFPEPAMRVNTVPCNTLQLKWNEKAAWDELAAYYTNLYGCKVQ